MLANYYEHTLENTLIVIENFSKKYQSDIDNFLKLKPREFFYFVSNKINYEPDPPGIERVCRPAITIKFRSGDCDDKTVLCLAYFIRKKIPCGYSIVADKGRDGFHHIFPFMLINGNIIDFDATYKNSIPYKSKKWNRRQNFFIKV